MPKIHEAKKANDLEGKNKKKKHVHKRAGEARASFLWQCHYWLSQNKSIQLYLWITNGILHRRVITQARTCCG